MDSPTRKRYTQNGYTQMGELELPSNTSHTTQPRLDHARSNGSSTEAGQVRRGFRGRIKRTAIPSNAAKVQSQLPTFRTMNSLWSSGQSDPAPPNDNADVADTGVADSGLASPSPQPTGPAARPQLARNQPAPPPPHQPPPPPAPQQIGNPADSLSLMQLRRIVTEFPRVEPIAYAFEYADTASFEEELDEWFPYKDAEGTRLKHARYTFERRWKKVAEKSWAESSLEVKQIFMKKEIAGLASSSVQKRCKSLQTLLHVVLGTWHETAGPISEDKDTPLKRSAATRSQVAAIQQGVLLLSHCNGISRVYDVMKRAFEKRRSEEFRETPPSEEELVMLQNELDNVMTIIYVVTEVARTDPEATSGQVKASVLELRPGLADYLVTLVAKLRWDDTSELPQIRIFLLFWKTILLTFGSTLELNQVKFAIRERPSFKKEPKDLITASPLDYHIFRQEITSKYPAYVPPAPLILLELENTSILPPLPNHPTRNNGANGIIPAAATTNSGGASILHQPVHIATPAPSPPPSPPVGGKAGKKQNYQTNQNFPFMYPPLDSTSNSAGGKGIAGLQEALVGRRWEGSEIPASILEAGELFAERTRMTRATRQLWDERERFLKFERGWDGKTKAEDNDIVEIDLDSILAENPEKKLDWDAPLVDYGPSSIDPESRERLDRVEAFYCGSIPHLQSLVIVLLKAVLANVTALITQPLYPQAPPMTSEYAAEDQNGRSLPAASRIMERRARADPANPPAPPPFDVADLSIEDLESLRLREITAKAVSGILLLLLKWFKISHVLKFEYMTQLLLDSNYLPLVLKLFAHSEVDRVVDCNAERLEFSFFHFCNTHSKRAALEAETAEVPAEVPDNDSEDDAAPPSIKLRRENKDSAPTEHRLPALAFDDGPKLAADGIPEIDELGNPIGELSAEPKTDYSWRNFFSSINYLRIMQKICKNKAHRNLLLVQYKSSNILKKALKIPQHELRLYTLKLFKNQVPYCGRKWRQGNMRVITAVYLHCRPELRDDWLAGSDVDAEVEEALPLEQGLRALTHWHNVKRYPEQMGADVSLLEEEQDFFVRELEKMDIELEEEFDENESRDGSVSHFAMN